MSVEQTVVAKETPEYCHFFKTLLVEELQLETDYQKLHYGQCAVIGRLALKTDHFRLENVRVKSLPKNYQLPEGAISLLLLGLTIDKACDQRVAAGCYCIVRGEVVLCNVLRPNDPKLTARGVQQQVANLSHDPKAQERPSTEPRIC